MILQSESLNMHKKLLSTTSNALIAPASFEFHSILKVLFLNTNKKNKKKSVSIAILIFFSVNLLKWTFINVYYHAEM